MDEKLSEMVYYSTDLYCNDIMSFVKALAMNKPTWTEYNVLRYHLNKKDF